MIKKMFLLITLILAFPISASAMVNIDNIEDGKPMFQSESDFSVVLDNASRTVNENTFLWANIIPAVFTVLFIYFLIRLGYALITKVGSTLKSATWGLISIPLIFIFLRIVGIFVLGESNLINVDGYLNNLVSFLSTAVFFVAIGMVLIGLLFRFAYILINHPAYNRWSNRLFLFSVMSVILSIVVQPVLYNI